MSESTTILSIEGNETYRQVVDSHAVEAAPAFSLAATGIEIEQMVQSLAPIDSDELLENPKLVARLEELRIKCPFIHKVCRVYASWQGVSSNTSGKLNSTGTTLYLDEEFVAIPEKFDVLPIKRDGIPVLAPIMVSKTTIDNELGEPEVQLLLTPLDEGALALFTPVLN